MQKLNKALLEAQVESTGVAKGSENRFAKFNYASVEEIVSESRKLLHKHGLVFYPSEQQVSDDNICQTYVLAHPASGEQINITRNMVIPGNNEMSECQAQGSAESYLLKNTLREVLLMPRFDPKEDIDSHDQKNYVPRRQDRTPGNPGAKRR